MTRTRVFRISMLPFMLALTLVSVIAAHGQSGTSFKVSGAGLGFRFLYSATGAAGTFANMATDGQNFDVSTWMNGNGHGYYQIGFNTNAPPAWLMIKDAGSNLGSYGQVIRIEEIGAVYLYDSNQFTVAGPVSGGAKLFNALDQNITGSLPAWQPQSLYTDKTYFGYRDETPTGRGGLFAGTADFLGPTAHYGEFNFTSWTQKPNTHAYLGLDVLASYGNGVTKTGRVYIDGWSHLIPEPAFYQMGTLLMLGGIMSMMSLRKARHKAFA